ncbi:MAG: M1 family metallopeptidase [Elusimicrobiota bacterium]
MPSERLPKTVVPQSYEISLDVDPDAEKFSGVVLIRARALKRARAIRLHCGAELSILKASINGSAIAPGRLSRDAANETLDLKPPAALSPGPLVIEMSYSGRFNRQLRGLYLSTAEHRGIRENYAFTQFEPADARRMLPCFDEPEFKATFRLSVSAPKKFTILSNMPARGESVRGGKKTADFKPTPKMSTYLLALAVARLARKSSKVGRTEVSVWTRPEDLGQADFALEAAAASLSRLNAYFRLPYQLPKMDLVAVPDFAAGAMENWGAIFFRDSAILAHPKLSSARARRRIAEVVAHEIVHQWFGDLVTMRWWDDLWLNESFATWLAYKIVDDWKPEWLMWQSFERGKREALAVDALKNTRPISSAVSSVAQIEAQFDLLTYEKGGAVLRMLENFIGENAFRRGLRNYISKHKYSNTRAADLWLELERASGRPVTRIARDWLSQPGYPIITASALSADRRRIKISQRRFSALGLEKTSGQTWNIPLVVKYKDSGRPRTLRLNLKGRETRAKLPGSGRIAWIYPNEGQTGFLRSSLDSSLFKSMDESALGEMGTLERSGFLGDLWALARSGESSIGRFLDALVLLRRDGSRMILEDMGGYLGALNDRLVLEKDRPRLAGMAEAIFRAHWRDLGWKARLGENEERGLARASVFWTMGSVAKAPDIIDQAQAKLLAYLKKPQSLDPAMALPVLNLGARRGGKKLFADYRAALKSAATPETRDTLLRALAEFQDADLARDLLGMTLTDDVRGQDLWKPLGALLGNPSAQGEAWAFIKAHWPAIRKKIGDHSCRRVIESSSSLWRKEWLLDVRAFFSNPKNRVESAERPLAQTLEWIELGIRFKESQSEGLSQWLSRGTWI